MTFAPDSSTNEKLEDIAASMAAALIKEQWVAPYAALIAQLRQAGKDEPHSLFDAAADAVRDLANRYSSARAWEQELFLNAGRYEWIRANQMRLLNKTAAEVDATIDSAIASRNALDLVPKESKMLMTNAEALRTIIEAAGKYRRGAGQGLAQRPNAEERDAILRSAMHLWYRAYGYEFDNQSAKNLGLMD